MPITESRELKQISLRFRQLVSRALRSNEEDARVNLRRLLAFVSDTPLLSAEIDRAPKPSGDVMEVWERALEQRRRLEIPDDPGEELGFLHALLVEFAKERKEAFWHLAFPYGGSDYQHCVREALHDTCGKYEGHLREVIEMALLESSDPAYDSRRIEFHVSGGNNQMNVAQAQAQVHAKQVVGLDGDKVLLLARELAEMSTVAAKATGRDEAVQLEDITRAVVAAVESPQTNRFTLGAAKEKLELLSATVSTVGVLAPYAPKLVSFARQLAEALGHLLASIPH